jgi:putative phosphoribosyl transferase
MLFDHRIDAAQQLSHQLKQYQSVHPLILAIPRGGLPLGRVLADELNGELDVVLVRKLGAPFNPEFAIGSVGESGAVFVADYAERAGADSAYLAGEVDQQLMTIRRRRVQYDAVKKSIPVACRIVIVVDDGLATGATMRAALAEVRTAHPAKLICAVPVASVEAAARIAPLCDELVCLHQAVDFQGVGQFYRDFQQIEDSEAVALFSGS